MNLRKSPRNENKNSKRFKKKTELIKLEEPF